MVLHYCDKIQFSSSKQDLGRSNHEKTIAHEYANESRAFGKLVLKLSCYQLGARTPTHLGILSADT